MRLAIGQSGDGLPGHGFSGPGARVWARKVVRSGEMDDFCMEGGLVDTARSLVFWSDPISSG